MDVVYVVKDYDQNLSLRLSLRSVEANLPHDRIWISGYRPDWVSPEVLHLPATDSGPPLRSSTRKLLQAVNHPEMGEEFYFFHDDFYVIRPVTKIPMMYRSSLREHMSWVQARMGKGSYYRSMEKTLNFLLHHEKIPSPLSYDLHLPLPMVREQVREVWDRYSRTVESSESLYPLIRTLYGNMTGGTGVPYEDVKVRTGTWSEGSSAYVSTSSSSFKGEVGRFLRQQFPHPSRYERG